MNSDALEKERQEIRQRNEELEREKKVKKEESKKIKEAYKQKALNSLKKRNQKSFWETYKDYFAYAALGLFFLFILYSNFTGDRRKLSDIIINDEKYILTLNDYNISYTVGPASLFDGKTLASVKEMTNNRFSHKKTIAKCSPTSILNVDVPKNYNFYNEYPECKVTEKLNESSNSYVQVALSTWRNRNCKAGGDISFVPSLDYFNTCDNKFNTGKKGGYLVSTVEFMLKNGIVNESCWNSLEKQEGQCPNSEALKSCKKEFVESFCVYEKVEEIKKEIIKNGPVISFVPANRNLLIYKSGKFELKNDLKAEGIFFVKIVGWEQSREGEDYWLIDPLFGEDWGQQGLGMVKIGTPESFLDQVGLSILTTTQEKLETETENLGEDKKETEA